MDRLKSYIIWDENMKTDIEWREYMCGLDLLGIGYKKVVVWTR